MLLQAIRALGGRDEQERVDAVERDASGVAVAAVETVLPAMREAGRGTIVFVNGATSVQPRTDFAGTSVAFAAESAYAQTLHDAVAPDGVHVTQLVIPGAIRTGHEEFGHAGIARTI